ncbi:MAG: histidinol-phosphate transaminase [Nitrospira sp.]|nr:histidinol-phosphate transaminase [Candidatus Manganitrophaceae bacterium]HIL34479.1 histidinol-phosphate transaminase [Candidatus Manganitrophaceae bacterium]
MMIKVHPDIAGISPYIPGKPIEVLEREYGITGSIKLASNENPLGSSRKALAAIRHGLKKVRYYPDGAISELKEALAEKWKVSPDEVMIGNGSNEIIELLVRTFLFPGDETVMPTPTFSLYALMVATAHAKSIQVPLKAGRVDLPAMAKAVTKKTKLVFVCNPNNPTGTIVRRSEVARFLSRIPKRVLVVFDEAYAEYASDPEFPDSIQFLREGASLVMLRTFSKLYGLAGLRIGYGISRPEVVDYLNRVRQPFNVNLPAQQAALAALSDEEHVSASLKVNCDGKAYLCRHFDLMGIKYFPSESNFICFSLSGSDLKIGSDVYLALLRKGVIIRHLEGMHLRVTVGLPRENRRFVRTLKDVLLSMSLIAGSTEKGPAATG